jgi:ankyrin repeat protein
VVSGEAEVVSTLLAAGADPEASQERIKWTPLHSAVFARRNDIAQMLLDAGASIEARLEYAGLTSLMMAVLVGDVEGVKLLLRFGCDTEVRCLNGLDAAELAAGLGEDEILELLGGEKRQDVEAFNAELQKTSANAYYERVICRCGVRWCRWCSQRFVDGLSSAMSGAAHHRHEART